MLHTTHPGPGYELVCDEDERWTIYYSKQDERLAIVMPEEDAADIEADAHAEGVSVEVLLRRRWSLPDYPSTKAGSC